MGIKVFNLQCEDGHLFEGWFRSHDDYDDQHRRGLVECPMCQSSAVQRLPSAPRLNMGRAQATETPPQTSRADASAPVMVGASQEIAKMQAKILKQFKEIVNAAEDVGVQFAEEARRIHEGESVDRPIRGQATEQERQELAQEGIAVIALPDFLDTDRLN